MTLLDLYIRIPTSGPIVLKDESTNQTHRYDNKYMMYDYFNDMGLKMSDYKVLDKYTMPAIFNGQYQDVIFIKVREY